MSKEIRSMLLVYIAPIAILSLVFVLFAPPLYSAAILAMISGVALMVIAFAFVIDYLDKK
jgi:positive regulator of sigma E activity